MFALVWQSMQDRLQVVVHPILPRKSAVVPVKSEAPNMKPSASLRKRAALMIKGVATGAAVLQQAQKGKGHVPLEHPIGPDP